MPDKLPEHFQSVGYIASQCQIDVSVIQATLRALGIQGDYRQNGIPYYGDEARKRLIQHQLDHGLLQHLDPG